MQVRGKREVIKHDLMRSPSSPRSCCTSCGRKKATCDMQTHPHLRVLLLDWRIFRYPKCNYMWD